MKMHIMPIVIYAQQRLRGSALPTEELLENKWYFKFKRREPHKSIFSLKGGEEGREQQYIYTILSLWN